MKHQRLPLRLLPALVVLGLVSVASARSEAQGFVTGAGTVDGFTLAGAVKANSRGNGIGHFTITVHPDVVAAGVVSVICHYWRFDDVTIEAGTATFHSVGRCRALRDDGTASAFESDNVFTIVDGGEPGPGADAVDVNFLGAGGVSVPGGFIVDGNFVVESSQRPR